MSSSQPAYKPHILFVITQGEMGGAQRYVYDLATRLEGFQITVAMGKEDKTLGQKLAAKKINVVYLSHLVRNMNPLRDLLAISELEKLLKQLKPDILHLNSSKAGVLGSLAAGLAKYNNVIFTAHGFAFLEPHNRIVKSVYRWAEKFASNFRKKIITVSEYDKQAAITAHVARAEKLITIHNGVNIKDQQSKQLSSTSKPTIGTLAHDYPTKDLKTLRSAFEIVKNKFPSAQLLIVGRGSAVGMVENPNEFLNKFDIYACSSIKEGFPYSILEAMATGLPIVSTNVGGIHEAITDGQDGLLVTPRDSQGLAAAIIKLIENPELAARLGDSAKQKVQSFSLDQMLSKTNQVYRELLN